MDSIDDLKLAKMRTTLVKLEHCHNLLWQGEASLKAFVATVAGAAKDTDSIPTAGVLSTLGFWVCSLHEQIAHITTMLDEVSGATLLMIEDAEQNAVNT